MKTLAMLVLAGVVWFKPIPQGFTIGYDTNGDNVEDVRKVYVITEISPQGSYVAEHAVTCTDLNKDYNFSKDECVAVGEQKDI